MKSLFPSSLPVFRECVNSRAYGSLEQHPFFFRKPVVTVGLFNGFFKFTGFNGLYSIYNQCITIQFIVDLRGSPVEVGLAIPHFFKNTFFICYFLCVPKGSNKGKGTPWKAFFPVHCPFFGNVWTHEPSARSDSTHSFSEKRLWPWGFSTGL